MIVIPNKKVQNFVVAFHKILDYYNGTKNVLLYAVIININWCSEWQCFPC